MANPGYVRSGDGTDADDGSTWALANATIQGGFTDAAAGDRIYVSDNHAQTQGTSLTLTSPGTAAAPVEIVCADDAAEPPTAVADTATVTVTGGGNLTLMGSAYWYGIKFVVGAASFADLKILPSGAQDQYQVFEQCEFELAGANQLTDLYIGGENGANPAGNVTFINTDIRCSGSAQNALDLKVCKFRWQGGTVLGTMPSTMIFIEDNSTFTVRATIVGVDLSPLGSSNLINVNTSGHLEVDFLNCKLGSGAVIVTGSWDGPNGYVQAVNCDSADTNYRYFRSTYRGEVSHETTIVRTGGASDGVTAYSRKFVSSANAEFTDPLVGPWFKFWNDTVGSAVTPEIEIVNDGVTLKDNEVAIEVEYPGTSGFPLSAFATDRIATILTTAANQDSSSEAWTTTGLTSPVKQVLSKSVTPQEKGWIKARVLVFRASTTLYACPKILADSESQYMEESGDIINTPAAAEGAAQAAPVYVETSETLVRRG